MNILIITPFYKHDRNIASVRWTNIGIRLAKKHNVIVITQPHDDMDMNMTVEKDEDNILVARINQKTWYEKTAVNHFGGATGDDWQTASGTGEPIQIQDNLKRKIKNRVFYASMRRKAKQYADDIVNKVIPKDMKIDVVISSACPFIEMLFGYELKKRLNCKWISDFRDLPFIEDNCDDTHIQRRMMQNILPFADAITVVVNNMRVEMLKLVNVQDTKINILTNGFSLDDYRESEFHKDDVLHIVYTGSLYGGTIKQEMLFEAMSMALEQNPEIAFSVEFAGGNNTSAIESAKKYGMQSYVIDKGFLSRDDALSLQRRSDYLLAIIRNIPGKGFAAKLFEYVLNQKNIICLITDDYYDKTDAETFIEDLNVGLVVKETDDNAVSMLADYLIKGYQRKLKGLSPIYNPNNDEIQKYNHDSLSEQVEKLCVNLLSKEI